MDKSWMSMDRRSDEYENGVDRFCEFALHHAADPSSIRCPCLECGHVKPRTIKEVRNHLICYGIDQSYVTWYWDGEPIRSSDLERKDGIWERYNESIFMENTIDMVEAARDEYVSNPEAFEKLLEDAEKPIYPGCVKFTKLSTLVRLYNLKAQGGWPDKSFSALLKFLGELLPEMNEMPSTLYEAKKTLGSLGMEYEKIHACPNDCILYRKDYSEASVCPTCGVSKWKVSKNSGEVQKKQVPAKVMWYFPPIPRFRRMFRNRDTAKSLIWHATEREEDGSEKASCSVDKEKNQSSKEEVSNVASKKEIEKKATAKKARKVDDIPSQIDSSRESKKAKQQYKGGLMMRETTTLEDDNVITSTEKSYIPIQTTNTVKKGNKCKLAVDSKDNIVAMGTVIMLDGPIHGVPLGAENVRISVDVPIKGDAHLPNPNVSGDIFTVKQAIGTHVAWPRHLVLMSHEEKSMSTHKSSSKIPCKQAPYKMPVSVHLLLRLARTMDASIAVSVPMEEGVFGNDHNTFINNNDIIQFCLMQPISTICISIYMRHLWSLLKMKDEDHLYAFVDPGRISNEAGKVEARSRALSLRLESAQVDQLILAPYNTGNHWLLAAINPFTALVYYFDPLSNININPGMKNIIDLAIKMFNAQKGIQNRKAVHWEVVKCPRQPGLVECGFYVMKYLKQITGTPSSSILTMFKGKKTYTQEEIDVVRVEWAEQVDGYIQDEVVLK